MDKRSLILICLMTFTLFLFNTYLDYRSSGQREEFEKQQRAKIEKERAILEREIESKTAALSNLPLVSKDGEVIGLEIGSSLLTLKRSSDVPNQLNINGTDFHLVTESGDLGFPVIYGPTTDSKLSYRSLPAYGTFDLQLYAPPSKDHPNGQVVFAHYQDEKVQIPVERLAEHFPEDFKDQTPQYNAIALIQANGSYLPVGIYLVKSQAFIPLNSFTAISSSLEDTQPESATTMSQQDLEEKFYVIETPFQQLVFSNRGASLVEINLPLQSDENKKSVVKQIAFDRDMVEQQPQNALFPQHPYYTVSNDSKSPIFIQKGTLGGYYPLLRRDLISKNQPTKKIPSSYHAFNIVHPKYKEIENLVYEVKSFDGKTIVFEAEQPYRRITKTFSVVGPDAEAPYCLTLTVKIEGDNKDLWLTSGVPDVEWISGSSAAALKYRFTKQIQSEVDSISLPDTEPYLSSQSMDWICNSNGFLGLIIDPLTTVEQGFQAINVPGVIAPSRLLLIDAHNQRFMPDQLPGYTMLAPLGRKESEATFRIFAGPFSSQILRQVDEIFSDPTTGYNPDYISSQTYHGWFAFISRPFAKFLLMLLNLFHSITHSWAFSIILLTVALRVLLWPLNAWSTKSMVGMQELAPELQALQKKYKKDPKKLQLAQANLYRERGVNPIMGCFPLLIQLPFLIGMFDLLKSTFELRGASFIPGWIDNLSAPDVLFSWNYPIFFIGTEFHALPILLGATMFIQQKLSSTTPKDPNLMTDQQKQQKMMAYIFPAMLGFMFYKAPSGLCIYFISSTLLQFAQQWWTKRQMKK